MAKRGPKPKPRALKVLAGQRADRLDTPSPPPYSAGDPPIPKDLDPVALAKWAQLVEDLRAAGTLSRVDGETLELYCSTYAVWILARNSLKTAADFTIDGANGGKKTNPNVGIMASAGNLLSRLLAELGLTPSSRRSGSGPGPNSAAPPVDSLRAFIAQPTRKKVQA